MNLSRRFLLILSAMLVLGAPVRAQQAPGPQPHVYVPAAGEAADVNGDGVSDVDAILRTIDALAGVGVKFDDEDKDGYLPALRRDGKYHMACIDLLHVCYRAAGYDIPRAMIGGLLLDPDRVPSGRNTGYTRSVVNTIDFLKRSPNFHFYQSPEINLVANRRWHPRVPFRIGDMLFVHYNDANDRHSGIVTGVDDATGLPTHITQVSIYNENQGLRRATIDEFFALKCRMLTGYARPACWDGQPIVDPAPLRPKVDTQIAKRAPRPHHRERAAAHENDTVAASGPALPLGAPLVDAPAIPVVEAPAVR